MPRSPGFNRPHDPKLQETKDAALLILAEKLLGELQERAANGSLAADFKAMRITQLTFQLQKLADVLKGPGFGVQINLPPAISTERLSQLSAIKMTQHDREVRWRKANKELEGPTQ